MDIALGLLILFVIPITFVAYGWFLIWRQRERSFFTIPAICCTSLLSLSTLITLSLFASGGRASDLLVRVFPQKAFDVAVVATATMAGAVIVSGGFLLGAVVRKSRDWRLVFALNYFGAIFQVGFLCQLLIVVS